ncbi:nuclear transport factor 2 family protein [Micromonospora sp. DT31]|uniref:nuclear transport factor 2 family protein n=1 Tax=Micromonospora sp. DT31 TaxID=3393434 RepID=UPI003CE96D5D
MAVPTTPRDVFHRLVEGVARLVAGDTAQVDVLADLYAENTHVSHPMSPLGNEPLRTRDALRKHFAEGPGRHDGELTEFHADDITVHETTDPEVVVAEFRYHGRVHGRPFAVPCVFVLRVRDGRIVESRDYTDHLTFARIGGGLDGLFEALRAADR